MKDHLSDYGFTVTGRISRGEPEIQTLNKRRPRPGKLIVADFSKIEERILARVIADAQGT